LTGWKEVILTHSILPSWREGETRASIVNFLDNAAEIPPGDRVAVFDNDGTMWAEKPNYTQLEFWLLELQSAIALNPDLADRPEFRAVLANDRAALDQLGLERLGTAFLDLFAGITPEAFNAKVVSFFAEEVHPVRKVRYLQTRYQPMLELMDELRSRGFDFYIVSAGGAEFMRAIGEDFYGVKPEGIVGSQIDYEASRDVSGTLRLLRTNRLVGSGPNEGPGKPPNIQRILGRRPCVAGGNSAGDTEMLEYALAYDGPSLALLVNHDDDDREYAYESVAGTVSANERITNTAARLGWTVASIKRDWLTVFSN